MKKFVLIILFSLLISGTICAQEISELQKQAEAVDPAKEVAKARSLYLRAFYDYTKKGHMALR